MENRSFALATGLFILGLVAAAAFTGNWLARDPLERLPYRVISGIAVSGLNPQAQVRFRGMGVGRVRAIDLDTKDPRRILIDIEVAKGIPVTRGTYAQLGQEGITGIAYVHLLDDGKDTSAPAKAADGVPEIPLRPSFMDEMFDSAQGVARDARELLANLNTLLTAENKQNFAASLASLKRITADLELASRRLPTMLAGIEGGVAGFLGDENRRNAREALAQINATASELPALARDARRLLADSGKLVERVDRLAGEAHSAAEAVRQDTLPRVNALSESVERSAERVGRLAYELERKPDSVVWGRPAARPGPGEPGFE
jgi:phospholipid/cholesterol/gamma-HCH transport system substrate-binding protein